MADEQKPTPQDTDDLGVSFGKKHDGDVDAKESLDPNVYEVANKHLAPTEVPGHEDVFNVTRAFDEDAVEMGTIVSDKKRKRSSLGANLKSAFNEWWGKTRASIDESLETIEEKLEKKEPKEKPSDTDRRQTVERAKEKTVQPPKEDHHVIIEKSKTLEKDAARAQGVPFAIKEDSPKLPAWSSAIEEEPVKRPQIAIPKKPFRIETPDLRKDMVAPVVEKRIKKDIRTYDTPKIKQEKHLPETPPKKEAPREKVEEKKNEFLNTTLPPIKPREKPERAAPPVFVSPKVTNHSAYLSSQKASPVVSQKEQPKPHEEVSREVETPPQPEEQTPENAPSLEELRERLSSQGKFSAPKITPVTHEIVPPEHETVMNVKPPQGQRQPETRSVWRTVLWIFVFIALIGAGVVLVLYTMTRVTPKETPVQEVPAQNAQPDPIFVPSFFTPDAQIPLVLSGTKTQFLTTLRDAVVSSQNEVTQFYPTRQTETGMQNIPAEEIFSFLNTGLRQNAVRSLEDVSMFGAVTTTKKEPFIIIKAYDFDVLFAGLLAWEETLYEDFNPLFGTETPSEVLFIDVVKNNSPIRVLYNGAGEEILLYAFINRNTVIITSTTEALSKILERF